MTEDKKTLILTLSDHPLSPSGVGTQTRFMIEGLLDTGKYKVISLGGAIRHENHNPVYTEEYGEDWIIYPVDGYGTEDQVRSIVINERPDVVWFMTDPRFWTWLWMIENEIRPHVPMVYYHVWDNYPYPTFNKKFYDSNDVVCTISKVTDDIVRTVSPDVECIHVPHAVPSSAYCPLSEQVVQEYKEKHDKLIVNGKEKVVFFWNNRNARRKQSGTLIWWFKEFLDEVGHDNATLIMHTEPKDPHGQDLEAILEELDITDGQVLLSVNKVDLKELAMIYNVADCTINISDAEGFGLSTLESLSCGTPVIVNMTGGLQEQVTDGKEYFGVGIEPSSKAIIGSQDVPYIYEDRISKDDFINALKKMYHMTREERKKMGAKGRKHVLKNYSFDSYTKKWDEVMTHIINTHGSWDARKNYQSWTMEEV
tara:strand:+ start:7305 stop:8576 length:1272 start_codon:yes stop_codon:yes gene_type:complete